MGTSAPFEIFLYADLEGLDAEAKTNKGLTAWNLMSERLDVSEEVQSAFRRLMAKLDSKSNCLTYFDAVEKMPRAGDKVPDVVEVKVQEIFVD